MTQITCPACQYIRKPSDQAPDWACPQCQRAYSKTAKQRPGFCKNHFSTMSSWRCNDCRIEFCADCVTPHRPAMSHLSRSIPFATCPECKGMCVDFQYAEKLASGLLDKDKANRRRAIRVLIAGIAAIPFVTLFNVFAPIELVLLFLLSLIIISEVLISQQILDYLIGGDSIFPWLYKEYHLSTTEHHTDSSKSNTFEPNASKTKEVILKKRTTIELVICSIIILSFPLRYYQGKHVGIEDAKRELPTTVWHTYSFYTPPEELPIKNMPIKRHTVGFYVQGYVAGHNKIVREWVQNNSSQHRTNL